MKIILVLLGILIVVQEPTIRIPINANEIYLTSIGDFGIERKARPGIPEHLHSGVDILPPNNNYNTREEIYPLAKGVVISKRTDGPYAQLIIEHDHTDGIFWSVYEHIAEINVDLFQPVDTHTPLARFFLAYELDEIGWQFNHFHFEILKRQPIKLEVKEDKPERLFSSYSLTCYTKESLMDHFYDPLKFLRKKTSN